MPDTDQPSVDPKLIEQLSGAVQRNTGNNSCCGNCDAFRMAPGSGVVGICCASLPQFVMVQMVQGSPAMPQGMWTPTEARKWCANWRPKGYYKMLAEKYLEEIREHGRSHPPVNIT